MFIVLKDKEVQAVYATDDVYKYYDLEVYEVIEWNEDFFFDEEAGEWPADPRTKEQIDTDLKNVYLVKREAELPSVEDRLTLIYNDMKNRTHTYVDAVDAVNATYPKPALVAVPK